jgi:hypothetical protein
MTQEDSKENYEDMAIYLGDKDIEINLAILEINKNKNWTIEIKELNLKYKRILEERNRLIQNNDKDLTKSEINLIAQSKNNNSLEMN